MAGVGGNVGIGIYAFNTLLSTLCVWMLVYCADALVVSGVRCGLLVSLVGL